MSDVEKCNVVTNVEHVVCDVEQSYVVSIIEKSFALSEVEQSHVGSDVEQLIYSGMKTNPM